MDHYKKVKTFEEKLKQQNESSNVPTKPKMLIIFMICIFSIIGITGYYLISQSITTVPIGKYAVREDKMHVKTYNDYIWDDIIHYDIWPEKDSINFKDKNSIKVRFKDGGRAGISCNICIKLPVDDKERRNLAINFKTYENFKERYIKHILMKSFRIKAINMTSLEAYSTRRFEFIIESRTEIQKYINEDGMGIELISFLVRNIEYFTK